MAKILGTAARFVSQEAAKKSRKLLAVCFVAAGIAFWFSGFLFGYLFHRNFAGIGTLTNAIALGILWMLWKWADRQIETLDKERIRLRKGAGGEIAVGMLLADLPDEFCVINDLKTTFGNIDHVVVGPTGVFAIETKNWRGTITPDGHGELLLNDRPSSVDKAYVKNFVSLVLQTRDKVRTLAPGLDPFIQAIFVFTSASVNAAWGTTGSAHCMRDDQMNAYIMETKRRDKLKKEEVETIARAFAALARMDADFKS